MKFQPQDSYKNMFFYVGFHFSCTRCDFRSWDYKIFAKRKESINIIIGKRNLRMALALKIQVKSCGLFKSH